MPTSSRRLRRRSLLEEKQWAGLVVPSETIPLIEGKLGLSRWQNIFFCEFDGPRSQRAVVLTVLVDH